MHYLDSSNMKYRRKKNQSEYDCYNDDFEGYSKETDKKENLKFKDEKSERKFLKYIFGKLGNGQTKI